MSVLIAPDSFKGTLGAAEAADALAAGWHDERPGDEIVLRPMADGGEGTLEAFVAAVPGAQRMPVTVTGPDDVRTRAFWLLLPDDDGGTAVVELASTSGIELLGDHLRPFGAHTRGFGEAIVAALDHGVSRLILGIGSSSSTDGGAGLLAALGARFMDAAGARIADGVTGLVDIAAADVSALRALPGGGVIVLTDVTNPLVGAHGAAAVFGPQKGLDSEGLAVAEGGLRRLAALLPADPHAAGAGAAGGAGFGLMAWAAAAGGASVQTANMQIVRGADAVAEIVKLSDAIGAASLVITGEGSYDGQSAAGKAPAHVVALAAAAGVPAVMVAGRITADADISMLAASLSLTELAGSSAAALADPVRWLRDAGRHLAREVGAATYSRR